MPKYELLEDTALQQEGSLGFIGRTGARTLARGTEAILGLPGDISAAGLGLANLGIESLTGKKNVLPPQLAPTSQDIREYGTQKLTGQYLEPQSESEKFYDDIISDAATILVPFKGQVPFAKAAGRALGVATAGNVAKWAAESVTESPLVGAGAKIGGMLLAGTHGGRRELNKIKQSSYEQGYNHLPKNASIVIKPEQKELNTLITKISRGDIPGKDFLLDRLKSITPLIDPVTGKANIKELIDLKQGWNKYLQEGDLSKDVFNSLKQGVNTVNKSIKRYGAKNPKFFDPYLLGEELTGALQSTNYIQNFLAKHPLLQDSTKNPIVKYTLLGGVTHGLSHVGLGGAAAIGGGLLGARESARFYQLISRSPYARKYYKNFIEASLKNDAKAAAKNLTQLDKIADKFEQNSGMYELLED